MTKSKKPKKLAVQYFCIWRSQSLAHPVDALGDDDDAIFVAAEAEAEAEADVEVKFIWCGWYCFYVHSVLD